MLQAADFLACPAEGARDTVLKQWRKATDKAAEAAAAGFTVPELPEKPRRYTCKRDPYIITTFLVGLDEVARIFYWVANPRQRCGLPLSLIAHEHDTSRHLSFVWLHLRGPQ